MFDSNNIKLKTDDPIEMYEREVKMLNDLLMSVNSLYKEYGAIEKYDVPCHECGKKETELSAHYSNNGNPYCEECYETIIKTKKT